MSGTSRNGDLAHAAHQDAAEKIQYRNCSLIDGRRVCQLYGYRDRVMATATVSMIRETTRTAIAMIVGVGGVGGTIGTMTESQAPRRKPESSDRRGSLHWEKTR